MKKLIALAVLLLLVGCGSPAQRVETAKESLIVVTDQAYILIDSGVIHDEDTARLVLSLVQHGQILIAEAEAAAELGQDMWKPILLKVADITRQLLAIRIHQESLRRVE